MYEYADAGLSCRKRHYLCMQKISGMCESQKIAEGSAMFPFLTDKEKREISESGVSCFLVIG